MISAVYNMQINAGDDFELEIIIKDATQSPINLTGNTYTGQMREAWDSKDSVATFVCTVSNQTSFKGQLLIKLPHAESIKIPCLPSKGNNKRPTSEFIYDIEQTDPSGNRTRILEGSVLVSPNVTR